MVKGRVCKTLLHQFESDRHLIHITARKEYRMSTKLYIVEYYYKTKWGYADEFLQLFKKNHLPVLKKLIEIGRIINLNIAKPQFHTTEDGRWDYRVTITWKDISLLNDGFDEKIIARELYHDQETFKKEEQRRFDILSAHWDLPVVDVGTE